MGDHPHGTRACYRHGCRCLCCRAANARYEQERARDHALGKLRLGSRISATEARRRIRQLKAEGVPVAAHLGLKRPSVRSHTVRVTVKTLLRIRALCRRYLWEPDERNA